VAESIFREELGQYFDEAFEEISEMPIAAASIG